MTLRWGGGGPFDFRDSPESTFSILDLTLWVWGWDFGLGFGFELFVSYLPCLSGGIWTGWRCGWRCWSLSTFWWSCECPRPCWSCSWGPGARWRNTSCWGTQSAELSGPGRSDLSAQGSLTWGRWNEDSVIIYEPLFTSPAAHGGAQTPIEFDHHQLVQHRPDRGLRAWAGQAAVWLDLRSRNTFCTSLIYENFNDMCIAV